MSQDYENFPREWYCESCMGQAIGSAALLCKETWDKIAEYIRLSEIHDKEAVDAFVEWGGEPRPLRGLLLWRVGGRGSL